MIFHEVYGCYFQAVRRILARATEGSVGQAEQKEIVDRTAFSESFLTILPALSEGRWPFLREDGTTPLPAAPVCPPTETQLRFLKTVSLDPRIRLFGDFEFPDVEPLFVPQDVVYFDRAQDGDPYTDEAYIARFRLLLGAVRDKKEVRIGFTDRKGIRRTVRGTPQCLEYSERDDKFRLRLFSPRASRYINLSRMEKVELTGADGISMPERSVQKKKCVLELYEGRNALERATLSFHFEKEVERIGPDTYRITLLYEPEDETELLIEILSFGKFVKVLSPASMVDLIRTRLLRQKRLGLR